MARIFVVIAAVIVYLVALGCALAAAEHASQIAAADPLLSSDASPSHPRDAHRNDSSGLPYRGITIQLQRVDWMDKYEQSIDEIAAVGADTVQFVVDPRMENGHTNRIWLDMRLTPNADQLGRLIKHAKDKKLRLILMPIVLLDNPEGHECPGK